MKLLIQKSKKTFHTKFGDYRPDITVETTEGKSFYIEIADTNKKNDDYIEKWDELGCDVLELDVNEQLIKATIAGIPEFNIIYSSSTGECYIKHYTRQDYDDLITERKIYWKRKDLINYKIQWERLDWFWRKLQDFYSGNSKIDVLIDTFRQMDSEDQRFICKRMRGKHSSLKYELENNYTDKNDIKKAHLQHISLVVKRLNREFNCNSLSNVFLYRKNIHIIFKNSSDWLKRPYMCIDDNTTENEVYEYFYPIMKNYYDNIKHLSIKLEEIKNKINTCKNKNWNMDFWEYSHHYKIQLCLMDIWYGSIIIPKNITENTNIIHQKVLEEMKYLYKFGLSGEYGTYVIFKNPYSRYGNIRIMEER